MCAGCANQRAEGRAGAGGVGPQSAQPLPHGPYLAPLVLDPPLHLPCNCLLEAGAAIAWWKVSQEHGGSFGLPSCKCLLYSFELLECMQSVWRVFCGNPYLASDARMSHSGAKAEV